MSVEKNTIEAKRWFQTAEGDLDTAIILKKNKKFAHACFHAQQAGEKAAYTEVCGHFLSKYF